MSLELGAGRQLTEYVLDNMHATPAEESGPNRSSGGRRPGLRTGRSQALRVIYAVSEPLN